MCIRDSFYCDCFCDCFLSVSIFITEDFIPVFSRWFQTNYTVSFLSLIHISDNSDISKPCGGILTYSFLCLIYAIYGIPAAVSLLSIAVRSCPCLLYTSDRKIPFCSVRYRDADYFIFFHSMFSFHS